MTVAGLFDGSGQLIVLLTGFMASGKSIVAQALADLLLASIHLRGYGFRRIIVRQVHAGR